MLITLNKDLVFIDPVVERYTCIFKIDSANSVGILKKNVIFRIDVFSYHGYIGGPPSGFGDSGRRATYFQGFGEKGHLFSGIWRESITFRGFRE